MKNKSLLGDKASSIKIEHHKRMCKNTTSGSIGIRLCGLRVVQNCRLRRRCTIRLQMNGSCTTRHGGNNSPPKPLLDRFLYSSVRIIASNPHFCEARLINFVNFGNVYDSATGGSGRPAFYSHGAQRRVRA